MRRADQGLRVAIVAYHLPGRLDPARDRRVRNDPALPDLGDNLVLGHDATAVLDEQSQQSKDLGLNRQGHAVRAQLNAVDIQLEMGKLKDHRA